MALAAGEYPAEAAVARILTAEKQIVEGISWQRDLRQDPDWVKFRARVENDGGWNLTLYGNVRVVSPYKKSYSLIWTLGDVGYRIFAMDVQGNHTNIAINKEKWRRRTHKQIWKDTYPEFAYTPDEVIPEEPNAAFLEFCRECNIVLTGQLGVFPPT